MIGIVAGLPVLDGFRASLAKADGLYALAEPFARSEDPAFELEMALEAYQRISRRYGPGSLIRQREASCFIAMGEYKSAQIEAPMGSKMRRAALKRLQIASMTRSLLGHCSLLVEPIPGRPRDFFVLSGSPRGDLKDDSQVQLRTISLVQLHDHGRLKVVSLFRFKRPDDDFYCPHRLSLYVTRLYAAGPPVASVHQEFPAADSSPSSDTIFRLRHDRLKRIGVFHAIYGTRIYPPTFKHSLAIGNAPTWKLDWSDTYTWTTRGFQLGSFNYPNLYSVPECLDQIKQVHQQGALDERAFGRQSLAYTWLGATLDIHRQYRRALQAWSEAERLCKRATVFPETGFAGDPKINLIEIRQRIRWIRHRQYNHWLLYRPYDWNLQIPPWTLAKGHRGALVE